MRIATTGGMQVDVSRTRVLQVCVIRYECDDVRLEGLVLYRCLLSSCGRRGVASVKIGLSWDPPVVPRELLQHISKDATPQDLMTSTWISRVQSICMSVRQTLCEPAVNELLTTMSLISTCYSESQKKEISKFRRNTYQL